MSFHYEVMPAGLTLEQLQVHLQQALNAWQQPAHTPSPLQALCLFQAALQQQQGNSQRATNQVIRQALNQLAIHHREHAEVLQSRFLDNEKVEHAANRLNMSAASFHRKRSEGLPLLAETLFAMERAEQSAYRARLEGRLEANAYLKLFGKAAQLQEIETLLVTPAEPWQIVISGIGGIGKTTLADAVARRMIERCAFADLGWVTARQLLLNAGGSLTAVQQPMLRANVLVEMITSQLVDAVHTGQRSNEEALAALAQRLKATPHLIVIDNLETVLDVATLLPTLRRLVNPSKILLTTRHSLTDEADLYHLVVPQLTCSEALALVRQEARVRNITSVVNASDAELEPIYATVGGNPLALRLVTGQLRVHPLNAVLADLIGASGKHAEALYTFIYRRSWELLDESSRAVLIAMPLVSEQGGSFELLAATCDLPTVELRAALEHLASLNLIDVRGDLNERRYTIHSLTRSFLHEQVIRWQQAEKRD